MTKELKNDSRVKKLAELGKSGPPASDTEEWQTIHRDVQGDGHTAREVNQAIIDNWKTP